ncbi:MAG: YDG domain-containing protein [Spirochaetaceae bacterium]|jgi:uncharacterized repeat protein (TIGR02543 family)|nr:YDG domain-containing protein [Spirochaetaceae bacterium]
MKRKYTIVTLIALALLAACKNPFVNKILPDNTGNDGKASYTVTFDKNHTDTTDWTEADPKTMTVTPPATTVGSLPRPPTRTGHTFISWNIASDGSGATFNTNTPVTSDMKVFAKWQAAPDPYTIRIVIFDNESNDDVTASPVSGQPGDEITLHYTLADAKIYNRLTFSGTLTAIQQVNSAGTSTRKYTINAADATAEKVITINATFAHSNKQFDQIAFADTSNVTKTYGENENLFTRAITNTGSGSGTISYTSDTPSVATVNSATGEVTIHAVGTATITATKAEDAAYAEAIARYTLTVEKKSVTITGLSAENKVYDGTTNVTITGTAAIDKFGNDDVTVTAGTASFADKNVGSDKTVTFSGYSLGGAAKDNYTLSAQPGAVADITALQLTITHPAGGTTKQYDGTTNTAVPVGVLENKVTNDTVTVSADAKFNSANVAEANQITVVYSISGTDAANYIKPVNYTVSGSITKADGRTVSVPTAASKTENSITVRAVTLQSPNLGQTAEYAIAEAAAPVPEAGWQAGRTFSGLIADNIYYVFARATGNLDNCNAGTAAVSKAIKAVDDSDRKTVVDFETTISGITFTEGSSGNPTVTVVSDPDLVNHPSQKSLQIATSNGESYNQAAVIPIYLPYALSNYESVSFRFWLVSGTESDLTKGRAINVYAAADKSVFRKGGFGNPANSPYTQFAANLVASTPGQDTEGVGFDNSYKGVWTEYELTLEPSTQTMKDLQGNIFIAIGINHQNQATYLFDDITFLLKDDFDPPPSITPVTAAFDNNDITVTMTLQGKILENITGGTPSIETTNYSVTGNEVTLKKEYLTELPDGTTTLTFTFSNGTTIPFTITKGLLVKYDFAAGATIEGDYPKVVSGTITGTILPAGTGAGNPANAPAADTRVLRVIKTGSYNGTSCLALPFNVGTGEGLGNYNRIRVVMRGTGAGAGDLSNKTWTVYINGSTTLASSGNLSISTSTATTYTWNFSSGTWNTYTGQVEIGLGLPNINPYAYDITSIELLKPTDP